MAAAATSMARRCSPLPPHLPPPRLPRVHPAHPGVDEGDAAPRGRRLLVAPLPRRQGRQGHGAAAGGRRVLPHAGRRRGRDRAPTEMAPLFPGCDYEHWLIVMDNLGGEGDSKHQMIDCYIHTLAKQQGGGQEEDLQRLMPALLRVRMGACLSTSVGCAAGIPGVLFVLPDSYVDPEHKDYRGS
ncbi:multiple organellar RNA editing factor 2, chloroplastic [Triticum aestivum]|uniref:multiple organellar RNA editing factor 2, chloroplastic n=1 Tax=Triticum aestivum TaxID=4565 RepID=UPI001D003A50|nr:multiple organellar RNA editing factor 2, chloroplastic-like [Triticum aestivum]